MNKPTTLLAEILDALLRIEGLLKPSPTVKLKEIRRIADSESVVSSLSIGDYREWSGNDYD